MGITPEHPGPPPAYAAPTYSESEAYAAPAGNGKKVVTAIVAAVAVLGLAAGGFFLARSQGDALVSATPTTAPTAVATTPAAPRPPEASAATATPAPTGAVATGGALAVPPTGPGVVTRTVTVAPGDASGSDSGAGAWSPFPYYSELTSTMSVGFADRVRRAYNDSGAQGGSTNLSVYSPATGRDIFLRCERRSSEVVECRGGRNAAVRLYR
ncbi:hypothetical protein [Agilicoccus flavus]|uniref:hypothetical protein n=1 Tax=Agilicoccus flavus TaxID=2775968 RepID=UPI001CF6A9D8|nr:hypothetical protein [Agilicoccus flavus]